MKIESTSVKRAFVPVKLVIESAEELNLFRLLLGRISGDKAEDLGLDSAWPYEAYSRLDGECTEQGIEPGNYDVEITIKEKE